MGAEVSASLGPPLSCVRNGTKGGWWESSGEQDSTKGCWRHRSRLDRIFRESAMTEKPRGDGEAQRRRRSPDVIEKARRDGILPKVWCTLNDSFRHIKRAIRIECPEVDFLNPPIPFSHITKGGDDKRTNTRNW